ALAFDGTDTANVRMPGPRDNRVKDFKADGAYTEADLKISVDRKARAGKIESSGKTIEIAEGVWSPWIEVRFDMSDSVKIWAILRVYPVEIGEKVRIYSTCMEYHPKH